MNRKFLPLLLIFSISILIFNSCKKEEVEEVEVNPCGTSNLCYKVGSETKTFNANWIYLSTSKKCFISFTESLGGSNSERIELEFINSAGVATGTYDFTNKEDNLLKDGDAKMRYAKNFDNTRTEYSCVEGKLIITKYENNELTGSFNCTGEDFERNEVIVSEGNLFKLVRFQ